MSTWLCILLAWATLHRCDAFLKFAPCEDALGLQVIKDVNLSFVSGLREPVDEDDEEAVIRNYGDATVFNDTVGNVTLFVPINSGVLRTAAAVSSNYSALAEKLVGERGNAVSMYSQLPQGAFSIGELVQEGSMQTALGMALGLDFPLRFSRKEDGSVVVENNGPDARILYSTWGCDGVMHVTDAMLWPGVRGYWPETNLTIYDLDPALLEERQGTYVQPPIANNSSDMDEAVGPGHEHDDSSNMDEAAGHEHDDSGAASSSSLPAGAIVAIALGCLFILLPPLLLVIVEVAGLLARRRRRQKGESPRNSSSGKDTGLTSQQQLESSDAILCSLPVNAVSLSGGGSNISRGGKGSYTGTHSMQSVAAASSGLSEGPTQEQGICKDEILPQELEMCKDSSGEPIRLGSGGYGEVYRGLRSGVQPVAIKIASRQQSHQGCEEERVRGQFFREIGIMRQLRDNNIVQFYGACCLQDGHIMLVTELMAGGDLFQALCGPQQQQYLWPNKGQHIALDIARGLCYLHSKSVAHLDIKSPNILLTADGTAKIGDMGLSKVISKGILSQVSDVGTFSWAAPEMILNESVTNSADVYSFGVVLWELATGRVPQRGRLSQAALEGRCPSEICDLIRRCLSPDPGSRPTARECFDIIQRSIGSAEGGSGEAPGSTGDVNCLATSSMSVAIATSAVAAASAAAAAAVSAENRSAPAAAGAAASGGGDKDGRDGDGINTAYWDCSCDMPPPASDTVSQQSTDTGQG